MIEPTLVSTIDRAGANLYETMVTAEDIFSDYHWREEDKHGELVALIEEAFQLSYMLREWAENEEKGRK